MHPALARIDHRPWPLPRQRWTWRQSWCDLLFAHWPVDVRVVRPLVPEELEIDEFEGRTWVGVVPFRMTGVMRRGLPDVPGFSAFPELNLRLYVTREGRPGVWFLSLDADQRLAVWGGRTFFHLPYFRSRIRLQRIDEWFHYECTRRSTPPVRFRARYRPTAQARESVPGTLEHFLTERYCLYAQSPDGRLSCTEVHHLPWPLQDAEAEIEENDLFTPHGLELPGSPALLHFAQNIDVVVWSPAAVASSVPLAGPSR